MSWPSEGIAQGRDRFSTTNQIAIARLKDGLTLMEKGDYKAGVDKINSAIALDTNFIEAYMYLGYFHKKQDAHEEAIAQFQKAIDIGGNKYPNNHFLKAESQMELGQYSTVVAELGQVMETVQLPPKAKAKGERYLERARFAEQAVANPVPFEPVNLGGGVNTALDEYLPALTADGQTLIITRREITGTSPSGENDYAEDFFVSQSIDGKWSMAKNLGPPINTPRNEGAQCISPDGRMLFFTACYRRDGKGECDIYRAIKKGNRWGTPQNLGAPVNTWEWESQPSISPDGRTLYFTSSRKGGKGGLDLWSTVLQGDGSWSPPKNLPFNTSGDDISPFIHPDNNTLYFASDGRPGMGGLDIFYVRRGADGQFGTPVNLGYPINTGTDDACLIVSAEGELAYFASNREDSRGGLDLYAFKLYEEARPEPVYYVKGKVTDKTTGKPLGARFRLRDLETGKVVASSSSDPLTGDFLVTLPGGKDYALTVTQKGYLLHSENFSLEKEQTADRQLDVALQPIAADASIELRNIFFQTARFNLDPRSQVELDRVAIFLQQNPTLKISIEGHTDNVGSEAANQSLSENRAKAVVDYLKDKGIAADRLRAKGFGQAQPIASNATNEGRAQNRRIEIRILSI